MSGLSGSKSTNVIKFLQTVGNLKKIRRTGWVLRGIKDPESIAGHMYLMSVMSLVIPDDSNLDKLKCLKLSIVHDLAECIVGDLTPFCGVSPEEKHKREEEAMQMLTQPLGQEGKEIYNLYVEYSAQTTAEAHLVKDFDRLDMILQAFEYEKTEKGPQALQEFFESTKGKFKHVWTKELVGALYDLRNSEFNST